MKNGLLATTALVGAGALIAGAAIAAEAPTWKLGGNMNFNFYYVDQDAGGKAVVNTDATFGESVASATWTYVGELGVFDTGTPDQQDHGWYFGVDEAELTLKVDGVADNGLKYGFKIELQVNTDDSTNADEARIQLAGNWGTLQLGDEDGAEDIMNYGGENLLGGGGGFDSDLNDVLNRSAGGADGLYHENCPAGCTLLVDIDTLGEDLNGGSLRMNMAAPRGPNIAGDSGDNTKISYFSPRFSGFQVGASLTPTPNTGDSFKADGEWENHYGLGVNYDNTFGSLHIQGSFVYSARTNAAQVDYGGDLYDAYEDVGAWSVGGIVGWGPFSLGANYTDNGDSGQPKVLDDLNGDTVITAPIETSYWNVAARYTTGPMKFAVGYFLGTAEFIAPFDDSTFEQIALTADYKAAPGLSFYAEIDLTSEELLGSRLNQTCCVTPLADDQLSLTNDATIFILGTRVSF